MRRKTTCELEGSDGEVSVIPKHFQMSVVSARVYDAHDDGCVFVNTSKTMREEEFLQTMN